MKQKCVLSPTKIGKKWYFGWVAKIGNDEYVVATDENVYEKSKMPVHLAQKTTLFDEARTGYPMEWDDENDAKGNYKSDYDKRIAKQVEIAMNEQRTRVKYGTPNPNLKGEPMFELVFTTHANIDTAKLVMKKEIAYGRILKMSPQAKRDALFANGINASGLNKHSELLVKLEALVTNDNKPSADKLSPMMDFLINYSDEKTGIAAMTVAQKCIIYELVKKDEKGIYIGTEFIGTRIENLIEYLNSNEQMLAFMKKEIVKKEATAENEIIDDLANVDPLATQAKELTQIERDLGMTMLKNRARELQIPIGNSKDINALKQKIAEKEAELAKEGNRKGQFVMPTPKTVNA